MSVPQDRNQTNNSNIPQPDPLPPDVKVIECSCQNSDWKSADNSKWTNIIKQPITVSKGSEIRVATSFIDQRGIDSNIIQFQESGEQQNNEHTLLTQLYTSNDGVNGKTCTYDYIGRYVEFSLIDPGQDITFTYTDESPAWSGGSGTGFSDLSISQSAYVIRPNNVSINDSGIGYSSNDPFVIRTSAGADTGYTGRLMCDEIGQVIDIRWISLTSDTTAGTNYTIGITGSTGGSGFSVVINEQQNGIQINSFNSNRTDSKRGTNYKVGDILNLSSVTSGVIPSDKQPLFEVTMTYNGPGAVDSSSYMDQGYNYEKTLLSRWAQTFDICKDFVRGKGLKREQLINSVYENDDLLSAEATIQNKEDEFCSGIFHTGNNSDTFKIYAPVILLTKEDVVYRNFEQPKTNFTIFAGSENNWLLSCDSYTEDGVLKNVLNTMPIGSVYQIQCLPELEAVVDQNLLDIYENIGKNVNNTVRIKELIQYPGSVVAVLDNSILPYVGSVTEFELFNKTSGVLPANLNNRELNMEMFHKPDTYPNGTSPTIIISTDANGVISDFSIGNGGSNNRVGMIFRINDFDSGINSNDDFFLQQVDDTQGWNLPASRGFTLNNSDLVVSSGGQNITVNLTLIPVFQFSPHNDTPQQRGNKLLLDTTGDATLANMKSSIEIKDTNKNGIFKSAGKPTSDPYYSEKSGTFSIRDFDLKVVSNSNNVTERTFNYGPTGHIIPFGDINDDDSPWFIRPTDGKMCIRFNRAGLTLAQIPRNTIMTLEIAADNILIVQLGDIITIDTTYYDVELVSYDVRSNKQVRLELDDFTKNLLGFGSVKASVDNNDYKNLNGNGPLTLNAIFTLDQKLNNTELDCQWNNQTSSLALTSPANFFNIYDINGVSDNIKSYVNTVVRHSYDGGGFYFISSYEDDYMEWINGKDIQFNSGLPMWNFSALPSINNSWRAANPVITLVPSTINKNQIYTTITSLWEYQPLYKQKTITINKPFVVPSDIANIWTQSAHKLQGAVNMSDGTIMVNSEESGLLQNEFIFPVYGSNNPIDGAGQYVKSNKLYYESGGLEPGHCIGKNFVTEGNTWLAGAMIDSLPEDENGYKYYNVFFRTNYTPIRGYNPFAVGADGNAVRTSLVTINQTGDKIGNANEFGKTNKKSLYGDTMLAIQNDPTANPATTNPEKTAYEQGSAGGNTSDVRFGSRQYYPINYLNDPENYPLAKASQYVGSQNIALVFDTNVSTFTFQYFHNPYTSPFIDGQGGTNSIRVFYGNRKKGIFNHETLGGVNVMNYCRPTYDRGSYSYLETLSNDLNPLINTDKIGQKFLNKIGFTDSDLGIVNNKVSSTSLKSGYQDVPYTMDITSILDPPSVPKTINSINRVFYGTTGSDIDSSDSILTQIPAPEISSGLETYNRTLTQVVGKSVKIVQKFGDYIFYPYSLNNSSNSFNDKAITRFDNATSTYASVGGIQMSNSNRGMGLPNTVGSTFLVDNTTIPITLNPDAELYLSYTIATDSSKISASLLPNRLTNAYMVILSSIIKQQSLYMDSAGFVNGMSIVNKTFLQGDYILSQGQLSFYAQDDFVLSEVTSQIVDSAFESPTSLGDNSTVIYTITNYNPKIEPALPSIEQQQQEAEMLNKVMAEHQKSTQQNKLSKLQSLNNDLYSLGLSVITEKPVDVVDAIRNQIKTYDLPSLTPRERSAFLETPQGQALVDNSTDLRLMELHLNNPKPNVSQMEIKRIHDRVRARTPAEFFREVEDLERQKIRERIQNIYTPEEISNMEAFGETQKLKERTPVKDIPSMDSGIGSSRASSLMSQLSSMEPQKESEMEK